MAVVCGAPAASSQFTLAPGRGRYGLVKARDADRYAPIEGVARAVTVERFEKPGDRPAADDPKASASPAGARCFESLYRALGEGETNEKIHGIVAHLAGMGFPYKYLLWQVRRKVGLEASMRLREVLHDLGIRD